MTMSLQRLRSPLLVAALSLVSICTAPAQQETVRKEVLHSPADPALPAYKPFPDVAGRLVSIGTDTMNDLMKLWITGFTAAQPGVTIDLQSRSSLSVPAALTSGAAQLAPLSRELNPAEVETFRTKHGYAPTEVVVALGSFRTPTRTVALTFYVNAANPITRLDMQQLDAMWCTSLKRGAKERITRWGQLGVTGEWADRDIHFVGVLPPDGVPNFISLRVCQGGPLRAGIFGEKNGEPTSVLTRIVQDVAKDPYAIGYAGFHNIQPGAKQVMLANTSAGPFYDGQFDDVRLALYPLTRYVYIYVDKAPGKPLDRATAAFLRYVLSLDGQRKVEEEGIFIPLPKALAEEQRKKLR